MMPVAFTFSPSNAHDAPEGRRLMSQLESLANTLALVMDNAYEDNVTH